MSVELTSTVRDLLSSNSVVNATIVPPEPNAPTQRTIKIRSVCRKIIDDPIVFFVMSIFTIWALFGTDIKFISTTREADKGFEGVISTIFFLFLIECIMSAYAKPEYCQLPETFKRLPGETLYMSLKRRSQIGSFYFYLDWIATLSLIFEMDWITGGGLGTVQSTEETSIQNVSYSRAGARAGRLLRLVRMIRLFRLAKLYKYVTACFKAYYLARIQSQRGGEYKQIHIDKPDAEQEEERSTDIIPLPESQVGAAMSDLTNRRVIVLVLTLLLVVPQLQGSPSDYSVSLCANFINVAASYAYTNQATSNKYAFAKAYNFVVADCMRQLPVIHFKNRLANSMDAISIAGINVTSYYKSDNILDSLRPEEMVTALSADTMGTGIYTRVTIDVRANSIENSSLSVYTTLFIICLLFLATMSFTNAIRDLVIGPIEQMVALVQMISRNPLEVDYKDLGEKDGFAPGLETTRLLLTINKIGTLMRVGFGEAGASVIGKNLSKSGGDGRLNLIADGVMIRSIFGFCDIRQFTDTTECLQEEVMLFVNRIAHILHSIVVQCSGAANKNIGDAFLLTWKLESLTVEQEADLADQALLCFCKALIELSRYQNFICNFSVAATQRLMKRFPGYVVRIGSGLHVGWAVEGAIGSYRKIDASYLSPHVNFTEFLESSTKTYGVPLLISEPFYKLLSPAAAKYLRMVDRIKKPGEDPIGIYTYDSDIYINWTELDAEKARLLRRQELKKAQALEAEAKLGNTNKSVKRPTKVPNTEISSNKKPDPTGAPTILVYRYTQETWDDDEDLVQLRHHVDTKFYEIWRIGMDYYVNGLWEKAVKNFELTLELSNGRDGPSIFLLNQIKEDGGTAPPDWPGYRVEGGGH